MWKLKLKYFPERSILLWQTKGKMQEAMYGLYVHWSSHVFYQHFIRVKILLLKIHRSCIFTWQFAINTLFFSLVNFQTAFFIHVPWRSCRFIFDLFKYKRITPISFLSDFGWKVGNWNKLLKTAPILPIVDHVTFDQLTRSEGSH